MKDILTADIGGTNSRFGHFRADEDGNISLLDIKWLRTDYAGNFGVLIDQLRQSGFALDPALADIAVIAVAGPVEDGLRSSPPLISWDINLGSTEGNFGFKRSLLINDFIAQAYACTSPIGREAEQILQGAGKSGAAIGVIGAGTGLGKAILIPGSDGEYTAMPSEGGHASFPFSSGREREYLDFLMKEREDRYITCNTVVSGGGLSYVHRFLTGEDLSPDKLSADLSMHQETMEWMARFYARVCRDFVLDILATGGLFIAGGVAARNPELIKHSAFEEEFRSSDTLSHLLARVPVFLVKDANSGLWGAALLAARLLLKA